jgi:hypothetical protein
MANPWFRLYHEFATDPKVQRMSEANQRRIIMLFCMKCSNGDVTLQDEDVAFQLRISNEEWLESKALFMSKNIIDENNQPVAWSDRQFASDSSAPRVAKHRAKLKEACNVTVTPPEQIQNRTDTEAESEKTKTVRAPRFDAQAHLVEIGVPADLSADWIRLRKTKKAEVTKTAIEGIAAEASKASLPLEAALRECCSRGWAGFKADWILRDGANARGSPAYQTIHDKRAETIAILTGKKSNERTNATERDITGESFRVA